MTSNLPDKPESEMTTLVAPLQSTTKPEADMTTILTADPAATSTSQKLLADLQQKIGTAWQKVWGDQPSATVVVSIILGVPLVIVLSSVINLLNSLPLLPDLLELIGLVYTLWFAYRYLLFAESRQELVKTVQGLKKKVFG